MAISDVQIEKNGADRFPPERRRQLRSLFRREGFVKVPDIVPEDVRESIRAEANRATRCKRIASDTTAGSRRES